MMFGLNLIQIQLDIFLGIKSNNLLVDWLNMKLSYKKNQELRLKIEPLDLQNTTELRQKEKEREEKKKPDKLPKLKVKKLLSDLENKIDK